MSGINDVLGGQHYLLQDDDLAFVQVAQISGNTLLVELGTALTSNSSVSSVKSTAFTSIPTDGSVQSQGSVLASVAAGRIYNTTNDFIFIVSPNQPSGSSYNWNFTMYDPATTLTYSNAMTSRFAPYGFVWTKVIMGDFNGDGLADPLVFYSSLPSNGGNGEWGMRIFTAADANQPGYPTVGPEFYGNSGLPQSTTISVGDFNNDGRDEIAAMLDDGQTIVFYSVDPSSLTITQTGPLKLPYTMQLGEVNAIAGRFRDCGAACMTNADLAVVGQIATGTTGISVIPVQMTPGANGTFTAQVMTQSGSNPFFLFPNYYTLKKIMLRVAPLASWPKNTNEQLLVGLETYTGSGPGSYLNIGTFRQSGTNSSVLGQFDWESSTQMAKGADDFFDFQVGNFDNQNSDGTHNPAWQLQAYTLQSSKPHLQIFNLNVPSPLPSIGAPQTNWLGANSVSNYTADSNDLAPNAAMTGVFAPGDFQSRSLRLGQPTVMTIPTQVQPDLVLAIPPMHVDWVAPGVDPTNLDQPGCTNSTTPCEFNLTVAPTEPPALGQGFATGFSFSDSSKTGTKQSATTSWGISVGETASAKFVWGDALASSSVKIQTAAKYTHDRNVAKTYNTYSGKVTQVDTTTVFSDFIFFTQKEMNIYYYPVIGQTTCANGANSCTAPGQQYVEFSVPDNVVHAALQGSSQWWYQPPHEPGNILSYPLDKTQLQLEYMNSKIAPLTQDPPTCVGIGASNRYSTTWISGSSSDKTTGSANSFQDEVGISFSSKASVPEVSSGQFKYGVDVSGHVSVSTLNETSSSLDSSQGIAVNEPSFNSGIANCCGYGWANYIYGLDNVLNPSAQTLKGFVTDPQGNPVAAADITPGPLFVGFLADAYMSKPGGLNSCNTSYPWWQQVYNKPDVALNHPSRWTWHVNKAQAAFNSADTSGQVSALDQQFYQMKGFFISKQDAPSPAPNMPSATAGDQLTLTTRVYNYSLVDTQVPVHVRIYGQLYCSSGNTAEPSCVSSTPNQTCTAGNLCGNGFEIGETTIASIPGFKSQTSGTNSYLANWTTAGVNFDTTKYAGDNLVFWVVTWMQDPNGNIVSEMSDHGMTTVPSPSISDILKEPIEAHSNNVGLYGAFHQFYVAPATTLSASAGAASLKTVALNVASQSTLGKSTPITITVQTAQTAPAENINVALYDGSPSAGGKLLDLQRISHVESGQPYIQKAPFVPETCGVHNLYTAAWIDGRPQISGNGSVNVTAVFTDLTSDLSTGTQSAALSNSQLRQSLLAWLTAANQGFQVGQTAAGEQMIAAYVQSLNQAITNGLSKATASKLLGAANEILGCGPSTFTMTADPATATVKIGTTAQYALALTPVGGFKGSVNFTCSGAPQGTTCSISRSSIPLDGATQQTFTVSVSPNGTVTPASLGFWLKIGTRNHAGLCLLLSFIGTSPIALIAIRRAQHIKMWLLVCLMSSVLLGGTMGCSTGSTSTVANRAGAYNITLTAISGSISQSSQLTLILQ